MALSARPVDAQRHAEAVRPSPSSTMQHGDDQRDAADGEQRHLPADEDVADVVGEGKRHQTCLSIVGDVRAVGADRRHEARERPSADGRAEGRASPTVGRGRGSGSLQRRQPMPGIFDRFDDQRRAPGRRPSTPPSDAEHQRLAERPAPSPARLGEAERLQHRDLRAALAHRHAHRVRGDEQDREGDGEADALSSNARLPAMRDEARRGTPARSRSSSAASLFSNVRVDRLARSPPPGSGWRSAGCRCRRRRAGSVAS